MFALGPELRSGVTLWSIYVIIELHVHEVLSATSALKRSLISLLMHIRLADKRQIIIGLRREYVLGRGGVVGR